MTALVAVALHLRPMLSASTRSLVWWCTLVAVLILGSGLDWPGWGSGLRWPRWGSGLAAYAPTVALPAASQAIVTTLLPSATAILLAAWAVVTTVRVTVLSAGLVTLRRWRARCRPLHPTSLPHLPAWTQLHRIGRHADVMVSPDVRSPCVLGLWTPIIALPPSALTLSAPALDAVLVHEYAHVQRRDDLTQFLQHLIGAVCALHPAVWWIDRQLTVEREAACDDWVVTLAAPTSAYAACLMALAAGDRVDAAFMPVRATGRHSQLADRVRRLVDVRRRRRLQTTWSARATAPAAVAVAMSLVASAGATSSTVPFAMPLPMAAADVRASPGTLTATARGWVQDVPTHARGPARMAAPRGDSRPDVGPVIRLASTMEAAGPPPRALVEPPPLRVTTLPSVSTPSSLPAPVYVAHSTPAPPQPSVDGAVNSAGSAPPPRGAGSIGEPFRDAGLAVADAGSAVGEGVTRGGRATAGYFTRLGRRVARSF